MMYYLFAQRVTLGEEGEKAEEVRFCSHGQTLFALLKAREVRERENALESRAMLPGLSGWLETESRGGWQGGNLMQRVLPAGWWGLPGHLVPRQVRAAVMQTLFFFDSDLFPKKLYTARTCQGSVWMTQASQPCQQVVTWSSLVPADGSGGFGRSFSFCPCPSSLFLLSLPSH